MPNSRTSQFDHHDPRFVETPEMTYRGLREECPVAWSGEYGGFWLLTRYEDVRSALVDWRAFTSAVPNNTAIPSTHERTDPDIPNELDPPEHSKYRQLLSPSFRRRRIEELGPPVTTFVASLLDRLLDDRRCDAITDIAQPISVFTLGTFADLPAEDRPLWIRWVERMFNSIRDPEDGHRATEEYLGYIDNLIADHHATPRDDFIGSLLESEIDGERLTDDQVRAFCQLLLIAGHETTASAMGQTVMYLAEHPTAFGALQANPEQIPSAIEELLRLNSPIQLSARNATENVTLHGTTILAGESVAMGFGAANRDERKFSSPGECDFERTPNKHLAFGVGPHLCLGAPVARLELNVLVEQLVQRVATISTVQGQPHAWKPRGDVRGLAHLPIELTPRQ